MGKRERHFQAIERWKAKFRKLSTKTIKARLDEHAEVLYPEARIALKELLREREKQEDNAA
jgi:hypothetical protein